MNEYDSILKYELKEYLSFKKWKTANEIFCLSVLRMMFYPKYENYVKSESPDWINIESNIGIEVTEAAEEKDEEIIKAFLKITSSDDEIEQYKYQKLINKNGATYFDGGIDWGVRDEDDYLIPFKKNVKKKIERLEKYRQKNFDKIGLIVYSETSILPGFSKKWIDVYDEIVKNTDSYDFIFFIYIYGIDYYEPKKKAFESFDINKEDFSYLSIMSRMIAEGVLGFDSEEWKNLM